MTNWILRSGLILLLFAGCSEDGPVIDESGLLLKAERYDHPGIYDSQGRYMLMRGANLNTLGDYWEANPEIPATAPYEPDHFRMMASYGFNVVRLLIHWSKLEPEPGVYDRGYLAEIRTAIEDAAKYGIYTLLDMHQDAWGKYIASPASEGCEYPAKGWDGAPDWATLTEGEPTCTEGGSRESSRAVARAFQNFWLNTEGIQDAFIRTWQEVVRETAQYPTVLGYDVFNEPSLGFGEYFAQGTQYNRFLSKLVDAIREAEASVSAPQHIIFFENTVTYAGEELPFTPAFAFTQDKNIVFAPHNYFEVIVQDILTIEQGGALFQGLADLYGTHCFIGEWGVFGNPASLLPKLKRFAETEDRHFMGSTWWQWCQAPGDPHGINWAGDQYAQRSMHLVEVAADGSYTGEVNELYLQVLGRARPLAIHGRPLELRGDPDQGSMFLSGDAEQHGSGVTELWIPDRFGMPEITGTNSAFESLETVEGGFLARIAVSGRYTVEVSY